MLEVWGRRSSANVQKVMWLIGELKLDHRHIQAGGPYSKLDAPEFLALNPNGLVPVIRDAGLVVWESSAIVRYIAARHGPERFWPEEPRVRAHIDQWIDWAGTTFQPNMFGMFWSYWRTPEDQRNWEAIGNFMKGTERCVQMLDTALAKAPFLVGDDLTLADIVNGVHFFRYFSMGIYESTKKDYPQIPHVRAWYERLQKRPAYRQHVMVSYDELRGKLAF